MTPSEEALAKIEAAFSSVTRWNGKPDPALVEALAAGFDAAYDLTAREGTVSKTVKAQQRRGRLVFERVSSMLAGRVALGDALDNPVAVAQATAWLGVMVAMVTGTDFGVGREKQKFNIKGGKASAGDEVEPVRARWVEYAKGRAQESPGMTGKRLAEEIYCDDRLNPGDRNLRTIENCLSKHRGEWEPDRR